MLLFCQVLTFLTFLIFYFDVFASMPADEVNSDEPYIDSRVSL